MESPSASASASSNPISSSTMNTKSNTETCLETSLNKRRKLRVLVITMGSERQQLIEQMFEEMSEFFDPPTFTPGVPSRSLRNRYTFLQYANHAGLLPTAEWEAIQTATLELSSRQQEQDSHSTAIESEHIFDCLKDIPVTTEGRRGSQQDIKLHYSVELWRKGKTLNRGRAVFGCTLAHLIAMKRLVEEDFDLILEDNVRAPTKAKPTDDTSCSSDDSRPSSCPCAERIWECLAASQEQKIINDKNYDKICGVDKVGGDCHLRFYGWLGSIPNLKWILDTHAPKRKFSRGKKDHAAADDDDDKDNNNNHPQIAMFPFPRPEHLKEDLTEMNFEKISVQGDDNNCNKQGKSDDGDEDEDENDDNKESDSKHVHKTPGGNPVWGCYAYWVSKTGYETLMARLRRDVGAMLWRGKRMRYYSVKPIDKILPRQIMAAFDGTSEQASLSCVQLTTHPMFFRAPMLTSKIHTQWDPEFCKSTEYQMSKCGLSWSDLWLSSTEREIVDHHESSPNGEWITIQALRSKEQ